MTANNDVSTTRAEYQNSNYLFVGGLKRGTLSLPLYWWESSLPFLQFPLWTL